MIFPGIQMFSGHRPLSSVVPPLSVETPANSGSLLSSLNVADRSQRPIASVSDRTVEMFADSIVALTNNANELRETVASVRPSVPLHR